MPALACLKKTKKLTQAQLGALLGVSQSRIAEIEANPGAITLDKLLQLLSALGASMSLQDMEEHAGTSRHTTADKQVPATLPVHHGETCTAINRDEQQNRLTWIRELLSDQAGGSLDSRPGTELTSVFSYDARSTKQKKQGALSDTYLFYYPDQPTGKKTENVCEDGSTYKLNEQTSDILLAFKKFLEQQAQHQHTLQDSDADKTETFAAQLRKALKNAGERTNTHAPTIFRLA